MRIESKNRAVLKLDDSHPARRFVEAFIDCRINCAGRELGLDGDAPIDQTWTSATDGRIWTFSGFVYAFICFDLELDGYLQNVQQLTPSETGALKSLPKLKTMMEECGAAARGSGNDEILDLVNQVLDMLQLWSEYLTYRQQLIARNSG